MYKIFLVKNIWSTKAEIQFSRNVSIHGSHTKNRWDNKIIPQIQVSWWQSLTIPHLVNQTSTWPLLFCSYTSALKQTGKVKLDLYGIDTGIEVIIPVKIKVKTSHLANVTMYKGLSRWTPSYSPLCTLNM